MRIPGRISRYQTPDFPIISEFPTDLPSHIGGEVSEVRASVTCFRVRNTGVRNTVPARKKRCCRWLFGHETPISLPGLGAAGFRIWAGPTIVK